MVNNSDDNAVAGSTNDLLNSDDNQVAGTTNNIDDALANTISVIPIRLMIQITTRLQVQAIKSWMAQMIIRLRA